MSDQLFIGFFGAAGAITRYLLSEIRLFSYRGSFPLNTLCINIAGCFFLAFILTMAIEHIELKPHLRLGLTTGFFGAFTTFSTFCKETIVLLSSGQAATAILYIGLSIALGFSFISLGQKSARLLFAKRSIIKRTE